MIKGIVKQNDNIKVISAEQGESLLSALRAAGCIIHSPCGGNGTCGKCKVKAFGALSDMTDAESLFLSADAKKSGVRLACKAKVLGDFEVTLFSDSLNAQTGFDAVSYEISPLVTVKRTEEKASFYMNEVLIHEAAPSAKSFGLAVDIGTTTVAVYLCDLEKGRVLGTNGFRNPQSAYGADVISRIDKIMKNPNALYEQQALILNNIQKSAASLAEAHGGSLTDIQVAAFCGNTVMEHIAAGIDPSSIANAPFIAPTLFGEWYDAQALGLAFASSAKVYFAPCFASYVGGDIACGMIATGLDKTSENVLFIDIGTNGEIGLSTKKGLYFCSAAAGPALEGAHIRCGMSGTMGAIGKICIKGDEIAYETVGHKTAIGICGSGIIDACAVMLDAGLLDETGHIMDPDEVEAFSEYLGEDWDGNTVFFIDEAREIYLNGKDIREIQLAKAAIAAGIRTLLHKAGIEIAEVSEVVLAGGFGSHIDPKSACRIGLIPRELDGKVRSVGNVAGAGAVSFLLSQTMREAFAAVSDKADYTELSGDAFFMEAYIDEMMFEE